MRNARLMVLSAAAVLGVPLVAVAAWPQYQVVPEGDFAWMASAAEAQFRVKDVVICGSVCDPETQSCCPGSQAPMY